MKSIITKRAFATEAIAGILTDTDEKVELVEGFSLTINGLDVRGRPPMERWDELGRMFRVTERGIQFGIGDFANLAEEIFGEAASQLIDADGWSEQTLAVYRWMASRIAKADRRMDRLSVGHHLAVAALSVAQQRKWLKAAAADDEDRPWTVLRLRTAIAENGDQPEAGWWVIVCCKDVKEQAKVIAEQERAGRIAKASTRRKRKES